MESIPCKMTSAHGPERPALLEMKVPFALLVLGASWLMLFWEPIQDLALRWNTDDTSYCWFVPLIALALMVQKRERLLENAGSNPVAGYSLLEVSVLLYFVGRFSSLEILTYMAMWLSLIASGVLLVGFPALKTIRFPLFLLLFAIPAPPLLIRTITFNLRLLSSALSVQWLHLLNVPAFRDGNIIDLGSAQLEVASACSGLRYIMPTLLIAAILGHLSRANFRTRALLLLASVPIAVLVNSARIVVLALAARFVSPELAEEGFFHDFSGWTIFMIAVGLLLGLNLLLKRPGSSAPGSTQAEGSVPETSRPCERSSRLPNSSWIHGVVAGLALLCVSFVQMRVVAEQTGPPRKSFSEFPMEMADWKGQRSYLDPEIVKALWADDYVTGTFVNTMTGNQLHFLVSYYDHQTTQHTAHAPTSCLLGGGWSIQGRRVLAPAPETGRAFPVQQIVLEKGLQPLLSNFWFQQRGRVITSEIVNKGYLLVDALTRQRTDGALVRVEMALLPGQSVEEAQALLDRYTAALKETLAQYVPD